MNPSTVCSNKGFGLAPASGSNLRAFAEPGDFLSQNKHEVFSSADVEGMPISSARHDFRGGSVLPWAETVILRRLKDQPAQDAQMAQAVEDAIAAERNRLARELHDAVTQTLFAASLIAEVLPDLWDMDETEARKATEELRQLTRGALAEMRTLLFELRPTALSQARLCDLLRQLSEAIMGRKGLPICLEIAGDCEIPCDIKVEIYRIVQESLNNVVKYARATRVAVDLQLEANHVHVEIKDNGTGFDPTCVKPTSFGLRMMRERAEAIHAELQITSQPGMGTRVMLDWQR